MMDILDYFILSEFKELNYIDAKFIVDKWYKFTKLKNEVMLEFNKRYEEIEGKPVKAKPIINVRKPQ